MGNRRINLILGCALVIATATVVAAPLLVYTLSLAMFGLPHVLSEFRYVDERFGARLGRRLALTLGALLAVVVILRVVSFSMPGALPTVRLELLLVVGLVVAAMPTLMTQSGTALATSILLLGLVGSGIVYSPTTTMVLLAVAHNLTPVGFFAEAMDGKKRRKILALSAVVFGVVPLLILSGAPWALLESLGLTFKDTSILGAGSLSTQIGVFVPGAWLERNFAQHMFTASVFLQCMHYAAVIHVLPRLAKDSQSSYFAWPARRTFTLILCAAGAVFFAGFCLSFGEARSLYGVFAAVHAWVELPILLLAIGPASERSADAVRVG